MSGYLEVKYPFKSNLGLNPFKSWKRQWCILRPSPTSKGGCLAVYCNEAGAAAGVIDLPSGSVVRRTKSRTRAFAFAIFQVDERKPRVLLAAQSLIETQSWMEKIRALLDGDQQLGTETLLKDSFSISIIPTDLAQKLGLPGDGTLAVTNNGVRIARSQHTVFLEWKYIRDVSVTNENKDKICVLNVNSEYSQGGGQLKLCTPLAKEVSSVMRMRRGSDKLSRSDGDLRTTAADIEDRRSSWYSGPSEVSLDDIDLVMSKESQRIPLGPLSRCSGAGDLAPSRPRLNSCAAPIATTACDDSMSDRRSLLSVASGIYEEIPDLPDQRDTSSTYCEMTKNKAHHDLPKMNDKLDPGGDTVETSGVMADPWPLEPTYESVGECVYATAPRRRRPPPLPPRHPHGVKLGESWNSRVNQSSDSAAYVTRHSSLGSLPRCCNVSAEARAYPAATKNTFSVFRKRLKSDSRIATSPKSETCKENKDVQTKKKKFDFTPTRDIFKNFKVSKKMKNLKISPGNLGKGETKSCEFLDETEHVKSNRCSKSVECLEDSSEFLDEFDGDLSIEFNDDAVAALALPQEIVDSILRGREQISFRLKEGQVESEYMPMSPIIPPTATEHHYIVMSPKTNLA